MWVISQPPVLQIHRQCCQLCRYVRNHVSQTTIHTQTCTVTCTHLCLIGLLFDQTISADTNEHVSTVPPSFGDRTSIPRNYCIGEGSDVWNHHSRQPQEQILASVSAVLSGVFIPHLDIDMPACFCWNRNIRTVTACLCMLLYMLAGMAIYLKFT